MMAERAAAGKRDVRRSRGHGTVWWMSGASALRGLLALTLVAVALAGFACSSRERDGRGEELPAGVATPGAAAVTPGCAAPDAGWYAAAGSPQEREIEVQGAVRRFRLYLPPSAAPGQPLALVFNFHGLGSSALEQEQYARLLPLAEREGFLVVSPEGTGEPRRWQVPGLLGGRAEEGPDFAFFDALLAELGRRLCIDADRVYATGMSNGAFFASALACLRPDTVAAVAPVAGVFFPPEGCRGQVPLLAFHGKQDEVVPYGPGLIFGVIPYRGAGAYVAEWARQNGCSGEPRRELLTAHVERLRYEGCAADTLLVVVADGGHTWPGSFPVPRLGPTTDEISAAELMWEFFEGHARGR